MKSISKISTSSTWSSLSKKGAVLVKHESVRKSGYTESNVAQSEIEKREEGLRKTFWRNKTAVAWSVLLSTVVIMESFDVVVTTGFFALKPFQEEFGNLISEHGEYERYDLSPGIKSGIVNAVLVGEIVGLTICGWVSETMGFKRTLCGSLALVSLLFLLLFFAKHVWTFILGQFLCGIPLGVFQTLPATYASEILPAPLKPYLTTYVNFCWAFGGLLGSAVQRGAYTLPGNWSWRLPIALQWVWPAPLIVGIFLAPESPWWLVRRGRQDEALKSLHRLSDKPKDSLETIIDTNNHEAGLSADTSYRECFRKGNLRRTEATSFVWAIQMISGSTLMYFSTIFFDQAGMNPRDSFTLTPVMYGLGCAGTFASWFLIALLGRKMIYLWGTVLLGTIMFGTGICGLFPSIEAAQWAAAVLLIIFTLVYDCSVGPVCYCLVTELPSSRLRQKTVALARCVYLTLSIVMNVLVPYMLGDWNWGPKAGFFFGGGCVLSVVWIYCRLPETKNKTVEEIDNIFERLDGRLFT